MQLKNEYGNHTQAARTAAHSLEAIEAWSKRTFYASLATAVCTAFVSLVVGYGAWTYYRAMSAMSQGIASLDASMETLNRVKLP